MGSLTTTALSLTTSSRQPAATANKVGSSRHGKFQFHHTPSTFRQFPRLSPACKRPRPVAQSAPSTSHRFSFICSRNNGLKLVMPQRAFYLDRWTSSPISVHHPATSSRHISNATSSRLALVHGPLPHHHTEPRAATRAARFRRLRRASTPGAYFRRPDRGPRPNSEAIRKAVNVSLQQRGRGSSRH